jgi:hypothetical protein
MELESIPDWFAIGTLPRIVYQLFELEENVSGNS